MAFVALLDANALYRDRVSRGTYVALSQNAADLLTSPGRSPNETEELMEWIAGNEGACRS